MRQSSANPFAQAAGRSRPFPDARRPHGDFFPARAQGSQAPGSGPVHTVRRHAR